MPAKNLVDGKYLLRAAKDMAHSIKTMTEPIDSSTRWEFYGYLRAIRDIAHDMGNISEEDKIQKLLLETLDFNNVMEKF
jgi:hypothetical protein